MWHVMGEPIFKDPELLSALTGDMRSLHDGVLFCEERRLNSKDTSYNVHIAAVPDNLGFVKKVCADKIVLRFSDIFDLFHLNPLHISFTRLYALSLARQIKMDKIQGVAIVDPYYMRHDILSDTGNRMVATEYLRDFFLENKNKDTILLAYYSGLVIRRTRLECSLFDFDRSLFSNISFELFHADPHVAQSSSSR